MRKVCSAALAAFSILAPSAVFGDMGFTLGEVTVGQNLETTATVSLPGPAPAEGVRITLTSNDPLLLLLSSLPDQAGAASISVTARPGARESSEFYVHGLAASGEAAYTVSAPGFSNKIGKVSFAPSGILISVAAPGSLSTGVDSFTTTTDAEPSNIRVYPALLDAGHNFVARQLIAGGMAVTVNVTSSRPEVGTVMVSPVTIAGGYSTASSQFHPEGLGNTVLSASVPKGFSAPMKLDKITATVQVPGIGLATDLNVGKQLQLCDSIFFAKPAPKEVQVTIKSDNPNLLLSTHHKAPQAGPVTIMLPAGAKTGNFCMESLSESGAATVTASAPGYMTRTSAITLTPSGFLLSYNGPPDEAELFRKEAAEKEHGILIHLKNGDISFGLYTAQLDPKTHRGADITIQPLRPGLTATLELKSSNPAVGTITPHVLVEGVGHDVTFTPLSVGKTVVTLATPEGFTVPGNANAYTIIVTE